MTTPPPRPGTSDVWNFTPGIRSRIAALSPAASARMRSSIAAAPIASWNSTVVPTPATAASSRWPYVPNLSAPPPAIAPSQPTPTSLGHSSATRSART